MSVCFSPTFLNKEYSCVPPAIPGYEDRRCYENDERVGCVKKTLVKKAAIVLLILLIIVISAGIFPQWEIMAPVSQYIDRFVNVTNARLDSRDYLPINLPPQRVIAFPLSIHLQMSGWLNDLGLGTPSATRLISFMIFLILVCLMLDYVLILLRRINVGIKKKYGSLQAAFVHWFKNKTSV